MARGVYDDGYFADEQYRNSPMNDPAVYDSCWKAMSLWLDEIEVIREAEKARLNAMYREPATPLPGSKPCSFCKASGSFDGYDDDFEEYQKTDCPACDGTGFKELITLEDYA